MKQGSFISLLILVALIQACCVVERLKFDNSTVPPAILNQEYKVIITASVKNNAFDDSYLYDLSSSGSLPAGLELIKDEEHRRFIIQGTPTEYGLFEFKLKAAIRNKPSPRDEQDIADEILVDIYDGVTEDILCHPYFKHEQDYTLTVTIM